MTDALSAQESYERGKRAEADGEQREAAVLYRAALAQEPDNAEYQAACERAETFLSHFGRRHIKKDKRRGKAIRPWGGGLSPFV